LLPSSEFSLATRCLVPAAARDRFREFAITGRRGNFSGSSAGGVADGKVSAKIHKQSHKPHVSMSPANGVA
jgi:hypothetical protein